MPLEMVKENMALNRKIGEETTQVLVEGDVIVPDTKPDIKNVLKVTGRVVIDEAKPTDNRVGFKGRLELNVLYTGKNAENAVYNIPSTIVFEDFVNMDSVNKDSIITVDADIEHLENSVINDRKIGIKAVVLVHIKAEDENKTEVITDVYGTDDIMTHKQQLYMNNVVQRKNDRFAVKEDFWLPSGKPDIMQILQTDVDITNKEVKVMNDKLSVKGILKVTVIYTPDSEDGTIETFEKEIPFNGFVEMNGIGGDMIPEVAMRIIDESATVMPNEDGEARGVDVEATVGIDAVVTDNKAVELVDDVYALNKNTDIAREEVVYPRFVGKNNTKSGIKEVVTIDGKYPEALQIQRVWGDVKLDDIYVQDGIVHTEGVIELEVMYIAKDDENPVNVVPVSIPFEQDIEVQGLDEDMAVNVAVSIDDISYNMLSDREVEIRTTLDFDTYVIEERTEYIIKQVEFNEDGTQELREVGSLIIYVVQPGDSLWSIAKKYNTTIDDILSVNEIENPDMIYPGQKLLILKR